MEQRMTRLRLDLGYDGTEFSGWAKQPGLRTVQGELERGLATLLRVDALAISLVVGGRTDAGVHARGQVCHLDLDDEQLKRISGNRTSGDETLLFVENQRLPTTVRRINGVLRRQGATDVVVHDVRVAPAGFDARFSAVSRRYEYRLRPLGVKRDPLARRNSVDVPDVLDLAVMRAASTSLLGLRDFSTFCKAREGATAVRTLVEFSWTEAADGVLVGRIAADAFCHSMVRSLVGAVTAVGSGRITIDRLEELLAAQQRSSAFPVMPAHGLSLEEIVYADDADLASQAVRTRARRVQTDA